MEEWVPRTKLGRLVKNGEITSIEEAFETGLPLLEPEIVDILVPDLKHEIIESTVTVRVTDSGKRRSFRVCVVVGNEDGVVGAGIGKGREFRLALQDALKEAKLNLVLVRRGCGSWECTCGTPHSIPFTTWGKSGSVRVVLKPAPRGAGLVVADTIKPVMRLAGIKDVRGKGFGNTRNRINFVFAALDALRNMNRTKIRESELAKVGVVL